MNQRDRSSRRSAGALALGLGRAPASAGSGSGAASASARAREFEFSAADFERIRRLIHQRVGIALAPAKQDMVYSRLVRRLRACGDDSFTAYLTRVESDRAEWACFVNALTTNLTSFFREAHHFDTLAERMQRIGSGRPCRIWCCAASTGEEAYSIAMTACETFGSMTPPVSIIASDVNTRVIADARAGLYGADPVARLSPARLRQFFTRDPSGKPVYRVRPELQRLVSFRQINLRDPNWGIQGPLDAIFCRNVMIYFDKPTQNAILQRFAPLLAPDGALFAGHSESFLHAADLFRPLGRTVYQRAG